MRQGGHSLITAMRREDSCPFQLACVGARPGSGPAMKSPNKIFFALRLGSFPFFFYVLPRKPALGRFCTLSILQRGVPVFLLGVPKGPPADRAMVISGLRWLGV